MQTIQIILAALSLIVVVQTGLTLLRSRTWWVRMFDFPRVQILAASLVLLMLLALSDGGLGNHAPWEWAVFLAVGTAVLVQVHQILPYTRLWRVQSPAAPAHTPEERRLRLVVSNVCLENRSFAQWSRTVQQERPDVIVAVEPDAWWDTQLETLTKTYPHSVRQPQDNSYGLVTLSRYPLRKVEIRHLVEEDVPSIFAQVELPCHETVCLIVLHPRPPRPDIAQDSDLRDAELVRAARLVQEIRQPFVVAGDLNDVAWSHTTRLFQRISGAMDPRIGRGIFATYHADHWYARYPLDHVFHSPDFALVELRRLGHVGSDHFPMLIEVALREAPPKDPPVEKANPSDENEASDAIEAVQERRREEAPQERAQRRDADS